MTKRLLIVMALAGCATATPRPVKQTRSAPPTATRPAHDEHAGLSDEAATIMRPIVYVPDPLYCALGGSTQPCYLTEAGCNATGRECSRRPYAACFDGVHTMSGSLAFFCFADIRECEGMRAEAAIDANLHDVEKRCGLARWREAFPDAK